MTTAIETNPTAGPKGLGGWMILPIIGMILSPIFIIAGFGPLFSLVVSGSIFKLSAGHQLFIWVEIIGNVLFFIGWIYALFLCFGWSEKFPKTYIAVLVANLAFQLFDLLIASGFFGYQPETGDFRDLGRAALACAVWIPYMLQSKRVRNTFYKDLPPGEEFTQ